MSCRGIVLVGLFAVAVATGCSPPGDDHRGARSYEEPLVTFS